MLPAPYQENPFKESRVEVAEVGRRERGVRDSRESEWV